MPICAENADVAAEAPRLVRWAPWGLLLAGCASMCGPPPVAELVAHEGGVEREGAAEPADWQAVDDGARFDFGDAVRTLAEATARLRLQGRSTLGLEPETVLRFRRQGEGDAPPSLDVEQGAAVLEGGEEPLVVDTPLGTTRLEPGARLRLGAEGDRRRLELLVGRARLEGADGEARELVAGEILEVAIGQALIELVGEEALEPPPLAPPAQEAAPATPSEGPEAGDFALAVRGPSAELRRVDGEAYEALPEGDHRATPGSELRLGTRTRVTARRGDEEVLLEGRGVYRLGGADEPLVDARSGRATLRSATRAVRVRVPGGEIVALVEGGQGSEASLQIAADGTEVEAQQGRIRVVEDGAEAARDLLAGESTRIGRRPPGGGPRYERGPSSVVLRAPGGSTFTVHAPAVPVAVGVGFDGRCGEGEGILEVTRRRRTRRILGRSEARVLLPPGSHAYRIRCLDEAGSPGQPEAEGRIRVLRDSGERRLPRTAPASIIDADGRPYTVYYQNRLPAFTLRWREAPEQGPFTLRFAEGGGRPQRRSSARFTLPSGSLGEGLHRFVIEGGGQASPATAVRIRFDNAAPTASLTAPEDRSFDPGASVDVRGIALAGWTVSAAGQTLPLDAQHRFAGQIVAPADRSGLAIRLAHPRRGVHYYVRRAR